MRGRRVGAGRAVPGTPRWARVCAWACVVCVLPSALWRTAVGLGVPLGWSAGHLALERIPGPGTAYVVRLSLASIAAAALTLGLVRQWGERVPRWVPVVGGRRLPVWPVAGIALAGAAAVAWIVVQSTVHWSSVSGFADRPRSAPALFMAACYLPAVAWAPLLTAVAVAYVRRRAATGGAGPGDAV